jgi:hypothetical protein
MILTLLQAFTDARDSEFKLRLAMADEALAGLLIVLLLAFVF